MTAQDEWTASRRIGARIRTAREAAGLTTRQLAEIVGIAQTSICHIESGQRRPGCETADMIATAVGVNVSVLLCDDGLLPDKPLKRRGPQGASRSAEYFWQRIEKRGPHECWPWTRSLNDQGYGRVAFRGRSIASHRVAYELSIGPVPDGLEIDHTCHDPKICRAGNACTHRRCCNPAHLEAVTHAVNVQRSGRGGGGKPGRRGPGVGPPRASNPGLTVNQRFGLYICTARTKAGLTQAELGEIVGLGEPAISNIESGRRGTTTARHASFVAALSLDLGDLLRFVNSGPAGAATADEASRLVLPDPLFGLEAAS